MKLERLLAVIVCALPCVAWRGSAQAAEAERVITEYVEPINAVHKPLHDMLRKHQALERVQKLLSPIRWPRPLRLVLKGCNGTSDAWYEYAVITICFEYLDDMWRRANSPRRPPTIAREDAFIGPFVDTVLHEAGHAIFDLLKVPLLGREEDAADQVAAYYVLQFPKELRRRMILGGAYTYVNKLKVREPRDIYRPRLDVSRHISFADEHSTPAQRFFNLLCIAYGSDKVLFADIVKQRYLPKYRADFCEDEYLQIDHAYRQLIAPHVDPDGNGTRHSPTDLRAAGSDLGSLPRPSERLERKLPSTIALPSPSARQRHSIRSNNAKKNR